MKTAPWQVGDVMALTLGTALGLAALVVAWVGASGEATTTRQLGWVALGSAGIIVAGFGNAVWLLAGRRAVGRRRIEGVVEPARALLADRRRPELAAGPATLVAGPSMTHYHRADCVLVVGKRVRAASVEEHAGAGRKPCGVCAP